METFASFRSHLNVLMYNATVLRCDAYVWNLNITTLQRRFCIYVYNFDDDLNNLTHTHKLSLKSNYQLVYW